MLPSLYIEDIFDQLVGLDMTTNFRFQTADATPAYSLSSSRNGGQAWTQHQGNLVLRILNKYKTQAQLAGLDYVDALANPQWKLPFRVIDLSKKAWVEVSEEGVATICLKFPFQLKTEFDKEFGESRDSFWDPENKIRKLILYKFNLIHVHEFLKKHGFEIDESLLVALGEVEEIWEHQDKIVPLSLTVDGEVVLKNACEDANNWWLSRKGKSLENDLLLAKSMGFLWSGKPANAIEKIAASNTNYFWAKDVEKFLNLCSQVDGKICLILDRAGKSFEWLREFAVHLQNSDFPRHEVRVCFRAEKGQDAGLNDWIKSNGFAGPVEGGRLLIFNHKPAKWLFKDLESVKLIATNNLYPPTNGYSRDLFSSHPCVIFVGDIKPSLNKERKIVEL